MGVIAIVLLAILILSAVLLVLVVLVQDDQGEGIGGIFGGSNTAFGSRSGNVLTRFTAVLATIFLVCVFGMAWVSRTPSAGNVIGKARQQALNTTEQQSWWVQTTPAPAPGGVAPAPDGAAIPGTTVPGATAPGTTTPSGAKTGGTGQGGQ